ncbi:hypothetical protein F2P81_023820 [Scophthalmus maximus]|uniref:Uncharacterized protein n=1 Tax=Scophthalmus maximus TaxID=52904 RepID=A0A6A4RUZ3_SCOMX|nr:hypothetical protein F2P81_023820 [Scophthalmus maximus]
MDRSADTRHSARSMRDKVQDAQYRRRRMFRKSLFWCERVSDKLLLHPSCVNGQHAHAKNGKHVNNFSSWKGVMKQTSKRHATPESSRVALSPCKLYRIYMANGNPRRVGVEDNCNLIQCGSCGTATCRL